MTLHASKGLEFPHVYMMGVEEELLPHRTSIEEDNIVEERRLMYVGITRARESLAITQALTRKQYGEKVDTLASRLLDSAAVGITGLGRRLRPFQVYGDIADGLEVVFLPVALPAYNEYLGYANWFYADLPAPYPALQMVWPDPNGVFPWQPGYDARFRRAQPLLGEAPEGPPLQ